MSHIDDEQSLKRKLDEYSGGGDDWFAEIFSGKWRKDESNAAVNSYINSLDSMCFHFKTRVSNNNAFSPECSRPISKLQFFVRLISEGTAIFFMEDFDSTVESVHRRIAILTGIPVFEQRLIYHGKQLENNQTLGECGIEKDATLHLVGRMRSTDHPQSWQVIDVMIWSICRMCKDGGLTKSGSEYTLRDLVVSERFSLRNAVKLNLGKFVTMTTETMAAGHLKTFLSGSVPVAIVLLYVSPDHSNKMFGEELIRMFITAVNGYPDSIQSYCVPILFEFCNLLRRKSIYDPMYKLCRYTLGTLVRYLGLDDSIQIRSRVSMEYFITFKEIFDFVAEMAFSLAFDLETMVDINNRLGKPLLTDLNDFIAFLLPLKDVIEVHVTLKGPLPVRFDEVECNVPYYSREIKFLYCIFRDLLDKMYTCLGIVEEWMVRKEKEEVEMLHFGWCRYLDLLKELYSISKLYDGGKDEFWSKLRRRKDSIHFLVTRYVERYDNHFWILEHKEATKFECRRHLVMLLLPEVKEDYEDLLEMLIDRSQLLTESFEYIAYAETETLHAGLSLEFKNEEATGPGVLREWFCLVCQELFNPQNALFVACPNDRRRFFPNPASKVHPLHLEYFNFSGRVIALALMHKVQVGIVFDRIFFLQLAGVKVCLDDTRDADPFLYSSCKRILEMDPEVVDQDALGLTFVREINELGSVEVVELCPGGKKLSVNSTNRREYVDLLIQHNFVISISEQVTHFAEGFSDIMDCRKEPDLFFHGLELKDLDWMLYGHESTISVEDWKAHTEYNGYNENDQQITWFWKCVGEMSTEQRKVLLFFWTSVKYLPIEGFSGLASGLYIYKATESFDHLPSSHTCFYRLCFPAYPSLEILKERLLVITQEHVGSGFGAW